MMQVHIVMVETPGSLYHLDCRVFANRYDAESLVERLKELNNDCDPVIASRRVELRFLKE